MIYKFLSCFPLWRGQGGGAFYIFIFILTFLCVHQSSAQTLTFHDDIAPIIHQHCTPCHQQGGVAPFSLITYEDVSKRGKFVAQLTQSRYMPPWKADHEFRSFLNEKILSTEDIEKIKIWVESGMKEGKKKKVKMEEFITNQPKPDLILPMTKAYSPVLRRFKRKRIYAN